MTHPRSRTRARIIRSRERERGNIFFRRNSFIPVDLFRLARVEITVGRFQPNYRFDAGRRANRRSARVEVEPGRIEPSQVERSRAESR